MVRLDLSEFMNFRCDRESIRRGALQPMGIKTEQWSKIQMKTMSNFWKFINCFPFPFGPFLATIHYVSDWRWNVQIYVNDCLPAAYFKLFHHFPAGEWGCLSPSLSSTRAIFFASSSSTTSAGTTVRSCAFGLDGICIAASATWSDSDPDLKILDSYLTLDVWLLECLTLDVWLLMSPCFSFLGRRSSARSRTRQRTRSGSCWLCPWPGSRASQERSGVSMGRTRPGGTGTWRTACVRTSQRSLRWIERDLAASGLSRCQCQFNWCQCQCKSNSDVSVNEWMITVLLFQTCWTLEFFIPRLSDWCRSS